MSEYHNPDRKAQAQKMFDWMMSSGFKLWHEQDFEDYVQGEPGAPTKEEILAEIEYHLG